MITLTTPAVINSVIGGNAPINYDKFVLTGLQLDPITGNVRALVRLSSTSNPEMDPISGNLIVEGNNNRVIMEVQRLDFYKSAVLTAGQKNAVQNIINDVQNALENGMTALGFVTGVQSTGV